MSVVVLKPPGKMDVHTKSGTKKRRRSPSPAPPRVNRPTISVKSIATTHIVSAIDQPVMVAPLDAKAHSVQQPADISRKTQGRLVHFRKCCKSLSAARRKLEALLSLGERAYKNEKEYLQIRNHKETAAINLGLSLEYIHAQLGPNCAATILDWTCTHRALVTLVTELQEDEQATIQFAATKKANAVAATAATAAAAAAVASQPPPRVEKDTKVVPTQSKTMLAVAVARTNVHVPADVLRSWRDDPTWKQIVSDVMEYTRLSRSGARRNMDIESHSLLRLCYFSLGDSVAVPSDGVVGVINSIRNAAVDIKCTDGRVLGYRARAVRLRNQAQPAISYYSREWHERIVADMGRVSTVSSSSASLKFRFLPQAVVSTMTKDEKKAYYAAQTDSWSKSTLNRIVEGMIGTNFDTSCEGWCSLWYPGGEGDAIRRHHGLLLEDDWDAPYAADLRSDIMDANLVNYLRQKPLRALS